MQRTDADAVARQEHDALGEVEQHEGELPLELREEVLAVLLVEMHDQLAVAAAAEDMAAGLKLGLALGVVEQLAVADHRDGAVLVEDGLLTVTQPTMLSRRWMAPMPGANRVPVSSGPRWLSAAPMRATNARSGSRRPLRSITPAKPHMNPR